MSLQIAKNLKLPDEAVTQTFAIIAQRRKGKTYTANVMAEEMVAAGIPWVALDPTGAWWGLRSSADGKKAGLPVYVFGGDHGDLPLERTAGKLIADLVIEHPGWYVLDFSHLESKEAERQVATDFAERFYRRKGSNKTPVHLFVDEADMFAPQRIPSGDQRMLGAFEALVRRGGIRGIGTTLITQRAAVLNKNVLEQIDVLIALRTVGPNDRKAIAGYVEANGTPEQQAALMGSLASLELGEAWVWEPGADLFERVRIRQRKTFNSSATPDASAPKVVKLAKVDLERISKQMADTIEKAEANDPKILRRRIIDLERQLKSQPQAAPKVIEKEVPVIPDVVLTCISMVIKDHQTTGEHLHMLEKYLDQPQRQSFKPTAEKITKIETPQRITKLPANLKAGKQYEIDSSLINNNDRDLYAGERRILETLGAHYPMRFTKAQLATLTKFSANGGTFNNYLRALKRHAYVDQQGNEITISKGGLDYLGTNIPQPKTTDEVIDMWRQALYAGERKMLDLLIEYYPSTLAKEQLAELAEMTHSGGTFNNYLRSLRRNGLAEINGSEVRASDNLFAGAAA